jgi:hypothetical protein
MRTILTAEKLSTVPATLADSDTVIRVRAILINTDGATATPTVKVARHALYTLAQGPGGFVPASKRDGHASPEAKRAARRYYAIGGGNIDVVNVKRGNRNVRSLAFVFDNDADADVFRKGIGDGFTPNPMSADGRKARANRKPRKDARKVKRG